MDGEVAVGAIKFEALSKVNYLDWSCWMKNKLLSLDLWEVVEVDGPRPEHNIEEYKLWRKSNATALLTIQSSCGPKPFLEIKDITSAKIAWKTLEEKYKPLDNRFMLELQNQERVTNSGNGNNAGEQYSEFLGYVQRGRWSDAKLFLDYNPDVLNARLTDEGATALMVAICENHVKMVEELVKLMKEEDLELTTNGVTALHIAAQRGTIEMVKCLVKKNNKLVVVPDRFHSIPLALAIIMPNEDVTRYLHSITPLEELGSENDNRGVKLLETCIFHFRLDIALDLLRRCPQVAIFPRPTMKNTILNILCNTTSEFPTKNKLGFWKRLIYSCIQVQLPIFETTCLNLDGLREDECNHGSLYSKVHGFLSRLVSRLADIFGIKQMYELKVTHVLSLQLMNLFCKETKKLSEEQIRELSLPQAIHYAMEKGLDDFVNEVINVNPKLLWYCDEKGRNIIMVATINRQAKIFSHIYELGDIRVYKMDHNLNNLLHMVGMIAPQSQLDCIPGAALQMQRELQWFKEMKSIIPPYLKQYINGDNKTPQELFTESHKDLLKAGEEWMKGTATSCTVVAALIVTIMFSVAFTVPGGNDQNAGYPIFLHKKLFTLFILSDAISLFSSSTSVLMFLGILTSRYAEEDFLKSLPTKLIIGLSTLFLSIVTMTIAFSTTLCIMVSAKHCILVPIILLAIIPILAYGWVQFGLLLDIFASTYRPKTFGKKLKPLLKFNQSSFN